MKEKTQLRKMEEHIPSGKKLPVGWALQDPQDYLEGLLVTVRDVVSRNKILPGEVVGIGVDFTSSTVIPVKADKTPLYLEISCGRRWWNYNGYFLNINGRICAEGLLVFGLGGVAIVYIIAPLLDNFFRKIKLRVVGAVCAALIVAFVVDMVYSKKNPNTGKGISTFNDNTPE